MIRLHTHPFSTFARRVSIALIEKRIPYEPIIVDLAKRAHRKPEFLAINPYSRVPALEEDGFVLFESSAILQYIEATNPTPALVPDDAKGRALVDMHMRLCDGQMAGPTGTIIFQKRFIPEARWDLAGIAKAQTEINKHLVILSGQLGDHEYLVSNRYSLADIAYIPFIEFLGMMEVSVPDNIAAWSTRLLARPSSVETKPAQ